MGNRGYYVKLGKLTSLCHLVFDGKLVWFQLWRTWAILDSTGKIR